MNRNRILVLTGIGVLIVLLWNFLWTADSAAGPREKEFTISARKYSYDPPVIRVNRGDKITIRLSSEDVTHGFYLEGYDIDAKIRAQYPHFWLRHPSENTDDYEQVNEISFVADKAGKFRYRCSITCGTFHPFMQGELIVEPNYAYPVSIVLTFGLAIAMIVHLSGKRHKNGRSI